MIPSYLPTSGQLYVFQERIGKMGLVDHEVRSFNIQDGLVLGDGSQVFIAQHLVVHLGLKGNGPNGRVLHSITRTLDSLAGLGYQENMLDGNSHVSNSILFVLRT